MSEATLLSFLFLQLLFFFQRHFFSLLSTPAPSSLQSPAITSRVFFVRWRFASEFFVEALFSLFLYYLFSVIERIHVLGSSASVWSAVVWLKFDFVGFRLVWSGVVRCGFFFSFCCFVLPVRAQGLDFPLPRGSKVEIVALQTVSSTYVAYHIYVRHDLRAYVCDYNFSLFLWYQKVAVYKVNNSCCQGKPIRQ